MAEKTATQRIDLNELKSGGFIKQTQKDLFTVRLKCPEGRITPEKLTKVAEVAKKYSRMGYCHLSFRQSVEIIGVHIDDFDAVVKELATVGQKVASCGQESGYPRHAEAVSITLTELWMRNQRRWRLMISILAHPVIISLK